MLSDKEFGILLDRLNRPWAGYRKVRKGVKKRLRRHMLSIGCSTIEQYIEQLNRQPEAKRACEACLRVTISRFFRDHQLWQTMQTRILPSLLRQFEPPLRAWSAGCAGGEEPYTLAMVHCEAVIPAKLNLLATDASGHCLERARIGIYTRNSLKELPDHLREKYFQSQKGGRQFHLQSHRLPPVRWQRHDLLDAPPEPGPFGLILLRNNLLTYYRGAKRDTALKGIISCLAAGGCLVTGSHEHLPASASVLTRDPQCPWVHWQGIPP
jgi:chemotaxis methyl-accepting protein methylase